MDNPSQELRPFHTDKDPPSINISHVFVSVAAPSPKRKPCGKKPEKPAPISILKDVSVYIPPRKLVAILGTSGSGKTTLLNCISGRLEKDMKVQGQVAFSGKEAESSMLKKEVGYVMQSDHLLPNLTVRETLRYAAQLKLPSDMSTEEKFEKVEQVIAELRLRDCADSFIGSSNIGGKRGISGGEKRRVSIGVQMLTDPSVLLLDEPTSGLDSFTAHRMMKTLVSLAQQRTVICTVHQPRSSIFELFDYVVMLSKGQLVYFGGAQEMIEYFVALNYKCPEMVNPADYYLDLITVDNRNPIDEERTSARLIELVQAFEASKANKIDEHEKENGVTGQIRSSAGLLSQTKILYERATKNLGRDRVTFTAGLLEVLLMSVLVGAIFWKIEDSIGGIKTRQAFMYVICSLQPYLVLTITCMRYAQELKIFDREHYDGMYGSLSWWLSTKLANLPMDIIFPVIFCAIVYWMVGMRDSYDNFLWFTCILIVLQYFSTGFAFMATTLTRDFASASLLCNALAAFWSYSAGFLLNQDNFPIYLNWIGYISPWRYGFNAMAINEFEGNSYSCPDATTCEIFNGDRILSEVNVELKTVWENVLVVACMGLFYNLFALVLLHFVKIKPRNE